MFFLAVAAFAADPAVTVWPDGTVAATVVVDAPEAQVRAALADSAACARLSPDVLSVHVAKQGRCDEISRETRGMFRPFHMLVRRCPTPTGWSESLVQSDDFSSFSSDWSVAPSAEGTTVTYSVKTELAMPVPEAMLRRSLSSAAKTVLLNLVKKVAPGD
jgi:carbon monoxide dehydrogenase subunit G